MERLKQLLARAERSRALVFLTDSRTQMFMNGGLFYVGWSQVWSGHVFWGATMMAFGVYFACLDWNRPAVVERP